MGARRSETERPSTFRARVWVEIQDPTTLAVPLMLAVFCLFRWAHVIAAEPYWVYAAVLVGASAIRILYSALFEESDHQWYLSGYVAVYMAAVTLVSYTTGWGSIMSIGFLFGAASSFALFGSRATVPCLVWTAAGIVAGQVAIALDLAPTMIHEPLVQGVAALGLVGALFVIVIVGRATAGSERLEDELRRSERRFSALVTSSNDIVIVSGRGGVLQYASPAFEAILGYSSTTISNLLADDLVHPDDISGLRSAIAAATPGAVINQELRLRRSDGEWLWFEAAITNLTGDPDVNGYVADLRDITRRKDAEDRLAHAALHDALTGLPNRSLVMNRAEQMLASARRRRVPVAALFLDLDDFKDINDSLGHEAGDQLLQGVAARLTGALRQEDTVGRLGGDEFVVLIEGPSMAAGSEVVAARILDVLVTPFSIAASGVPLEVTASIGIAEGVRSHAGELLRDADIALYRAKASGKHCAVAFSPTMHAALDDHRSMEMDLRNALEDSQFFLLYQPTVDLSTGTFIGVEALLRWQHPARGLVGPNEFIPILEATGLIIPIGRWILNEACRQGQEWHRQGHRIAMSVNISGVQLQRDRIIDDVQAALVASDFDPTHLILELTETTLMHDVEASVTRLNLLKALGINLAIDDFGTGYSSLAYLRQFPIDVLKIDQSFVSGVAHAKESAAIVHTLVQLGKVLDLETVAEGIESEDQRILLQAEDVNIGQGYLFARPLEAKAVGQLLDVARADSSVAGIGR
jgi:diguanylate cyclase (GGDEF)-like protein/PAS domain S-box-containing protein